MAKGDSNKVQNQVDQQGGTAQNNLNNLWGQNTDRTTNYQNLYQGAVGQNQGNYDDVMNSLKQFVNRGAAPNANTNGNGGQSPEAFIANWQSKNAPNKQALLGALQEAGYNASDYMYGNTSSGNEISLNGQKYKVIANENSSNPQHYVAGTDDGGGGGGGAIGSALQGYGNFAENGGFSPQDIQNIRARSIAPIRSMQDRNSQEIQRQAAIRGTGYSPNTSAAIAKTARDSNYAMGDTATNAEAMIAQLMQQGKLYGLGGLASTGLSDRGMDLTNKGLDINNANTNRGLDLSGISGMTSLYGTTPGLTNMFGNQVLNSADQGIRMGGLQNQLAGQIMNGQFQKSQIPGDFQSALGNIGSIGSLIGNVAGSIAGLPKLGRGSSTNGYNYGDQ